MTFDELATEVERECSFLSYYIEEYSDQMKRDKENKQLRKLNEALQTKFNKFDRIHKLIISIKKEDGLQTRLHR